MMLQKVYHENTDFLHVDTLDQVNYFIPFRKGEDPFCEREQSSEFELLNGDWDFKYYPCFDDFRYSEEEIVYPVKMPVPACLELYTEQLMAAGLKEAVEKERIGNELYASGKPIYTNILYPIPFDPPYVPTENPCGVYRRFIDVSLKPDERIILNFEGVDSCYYLFVNGCFAGYNQVTHMTGSFDITDRLHDGKNEIRVAVLKWCDGTYLEDQDKWRMFGIIRDVYLLRRPANAVDSYVINTVSKKFLEHGTYAKDTKVSVKVACKEETTVTLFADEKMSLTAMPKNGTAEFVFELKEGNAWTSETPYLYELTIESAGEIIGEKVGIRKVSVEDGAVCVNGVPVNLHGTNRHESYPDSGAVCTRDKVLKDLLLIKSYNMNIIRTSHYPNMPEFYKMCDEIGFFVVDEADMEAHGSQPAVDSWTREAMNAVAKLPMFEQPIIDRTVSMVKRDINRPCIIFWSLGNESGYSQAFKKAAKEAKRLDPTRLIHYESICWDKESPECDRGKGELDVVSYMYPSPEWIRDVFLKDKEEKRPFFLCEYCHAMGNGPGDLEDYQQLMYSDKRLAGGCIWEWADHGIEVCEDGIPAAGRRYSGKLRDGEKTKYFYGGDFDDITHDGDFCMDGLNYPDRRPHVAVLEAKNVYRPLRVKAVDIKKGKYEITNYFNFAVAEDLVGLSYEVTELGRVILSGEIEDLDIAAGTSKQIVIPELANPSGNSLYVRFLTRMLSDNSPAGFDEIVLAEKEYDPSLIDVSDGTDGFCASKTDARTGEEKALVENKLSVEENYRNITISGVTEKGEMKVVVDRRTGLPSEIIRNGAALLKRPLGFTVFRAPADNDINIRRDWEKLNLRKLDPKVYEIAAEEKEDGTVDIVSRLSLAWLVRKPVVTMNLRINISTDASITYHVDAEVLDYASELPRFGLRFFLDNTFENVKYYGYGPFESYTDKHMASFMGLFADTVTGLHEDYIFPQENGSHYHTEYLEISEENGRKITFTPGNTCVPGNAFSFNCSHYTAEELCDKKHNFELKESGYTVVCVDYKMDGVGSNACGPFLNPKYAFKEKKFSWTIKMD